MASNVTMNPRDYEGIVQTIAEKAVERMDLRESEGKDGWQHAPVEWMLQGASNHIDDAYTEEVTQSDILDAICYLIFAYHLEEKNGS